MLCRSFTCIVWEIWTYEFESIFLNHAVLYIICSKLTEWRKERFFLCFFLASATGDFQFVRNNCRWMWGTVKKWWCQLTKPSFNYRYRQHSVAYLTCSRSPSRPPSPPQGGPFVIITEVTSKFLTPLTSGRRTDIVWKDLTRDVRLEAFLTHGLGCCDHLVSSMACRPNISHFFCY